MSKNRKIVVSVVSLSIILIVGIIVLNRKSENDPAIVPGNPTEIENIGETDITNATATPEIEEIEITGFITPLGPGTDTDNNDPENTTIDGGFTGTPTPVEIDPGSITTAPIDDNNEGTLPVENVSFSSIEELKNGTFSEGQTVNTTGYYYDGDGGGAVYLIKAGSVAGNCGTVIALNNGLYAELQYDEKVSIKQFGAYGDGNANDSSAFNAALSSGISEIVIPAGTYELGGNIVKTANFVKLTGESQDVSIIKNGCISSEFGISISDITFDGGALQRIRYTGGRHEDGTIILFVSPNGKQEISYVNCTFKNATVVSFARESNGTFAKDTVTGCTFADIRKVAIFHSLDIDNAVYKDNKFINLGGSDILKGFISALWIGDVSNSNFVQAENLTIENNTFLNLFTQDDFSGTSHILSANFIAVRADKALINGNTISNLQGYGEDREAVYTKVRDLTISNNVITDGGLGEGFICNKSHEGDSYCIITGNTFNGNAGCAIRSYCPGEISNNMINIDNCPNVITNTLKTDITNSRELIIKGNIINSGTYTDLNVNGRTISSYSTGKAVRISDFTNPIIIENNTFNTATPFHQYIAIGNPGISVKICDNVINDVEKDGTGIYVFTNKEGGNRSTDCDVVVERNQFSMVSGAKATRISFVQDSGLATSRDIVFSDNTITFSGTTSTEKVLVCESSNGNKDCLISQGNDCNLSQNKTHVSYTVDSIETDDSDFAVYRKK